ncbi:ABC transporter permease [Dyadobacter bucti]|uniref:ABC transporter permease n=1 Tax=Dyadobacter bucti TaxID=2572203 RepID=UPI0011087E3A|nr:ABC transporter permease [Dyadobacter bucti]
MMRYFPPRWITALFRWFADPDTLEETEGDLLEMYAYWVGAVGLRKARWKYIFTVVRLLRPFAKHKRSKEYPQPFLFSHAMIRNYFKIAFRNLRQNKAYAIINVSGLMLGITCAMLIFMLVKYHLGFDRFHSKSDHIYRIVTEMHRDDIAYVGSVPSPLGKVFRNDYTFAEKVARIASFNEQLISVKTGNEVRKFKEEEGVAFAETEYFDIFNFPLSEGDYETALAEPNSVIVTERIAKKYFGSTHVINKTFRFDNRIDVTIKGVLRDLPETTDQKAEIFVSYPTLKQYNDWLASDDSWGGIQSSMQCYVRLRPGIAVSEVEKVFPAYVKRYRPESKNVHHYKLQPLSDIHFNARYGGTMEKRNLWILSVIGTFLIITACVNFINLATAQTLKLSKEVGVRKVLGSGRGQLFWQFIAQTSLITGIATLASVLITMLVLPYFNQLFETRIRLDFLSDWQLFVFLAGLMVLVTLFAGSYPGLIIARFQPIMALKGKLSQQNIGGFNTRRALIITQFAISQILIIGMIVIAKQMHYSQQSDLGFVKDAVVMLPIASEPGAAKTVKNQLQQIAGVENVSLCFDAPASDNNWGTTPYYDNRSEEEAFRITMRPADQDYVKTFGLKVLAGRNIFPSDTTREFLVNETFARKLNLASSTEVLGKQLRVNGNMTGLIVGVIKDFHDTSFHEDINPICISSASDRYASYAVKINLGNMPATMAAIEKVWSKTHPDEIYEYEFLNDQIASFYDTEALMLTLIQIFSSIAVFIGCLGLYGLVSFMAVQKTKEIGIRKVLGSSINQILWIFGKEFVLLIVFAFCIAAPVAWWLMRGWLKDFKFRIELGAWIFALSIFITLGIAALTVLFKSFRAATMDPVKSLRNE